MAKTGNFISQVKTEMQKVAWPSRQELISSTVVVLVSTLVLAAYIGICDLVISRSVHVLIRGIF